MATFKITAPRKLGEVKEGTSFIVVSQSNLHHEDIAEVLYINGYKKMGADTVQSYCSAGNWKCEKINDEVFPALTEQHNRFLEEVYRDARQSPDKDIKLCGQIYYSPKIAGPVYDRIKREDKIKSEKEQNQPGSGSPKDSSTQSKKSGTNKKDGDGCLVKILKSPFKLLWWVIKKILGILTLGLLSSWLNGK